MQVHLPDASTVTLVQPGIGLPVAPSITLTVVLAGAVPEMVGVPVATVVLAAGDVTAGFVRSTVAEIAGPVLLPPLLSETVGVRECKPSAKPDPLTVHNH